MAEHTPGPWVVDEFYEEGGFFKIRARESALCHVHASAKAWDDAETAVESLMIGWTGKIFHRECAPDG